MQHSRRNFLAQSGSLLWMSTFQSANLKPIPKPSASDSQVVGETSSIGFWTQFFNPVDNGNGAERGEKPKAQPATPGSQVEYVHLGPNGLRYVQDTKPEDLADISGDVMLSVSPSQFRFGGAGKAQDFVHSAQLRFDIHQSQRFLNVLPYLAWTSLAAIFPEKSGRIPSIQQLNFTSSSAESAVEKILLPGGIGKIAVNLSTAKKTSAIYKVLQDIAKEARVVSPVLGLPAISLVALEAFTALYSHVEQRTTFLLSSGPASIAVTQEGWSSPDRAAQAIPLPPGDYVLYPKEHSDLIRTEFDKLTIENGYLVRSDSDRTIPVAERAEQAAKGVTYVTMRISVSNVNLAQTDRSSNPGKSDQISGPKPSEKKKKPN